MFLKGINIAGAPLFPLCLGIPAVKTVGCLDAMSRVGFYQKISFSMKGFANGVEGCRAELWGSVNGLGDAIQNDRS